MTDVIEQVSSVSERWVYPAQWAYRGVNRVPLAHQARWTSRAPAIDRGRLGVCSLAGLSAGLSGGPPAGPPGPSTFSIASLGVSTVPDVAIGCAGVRQS